MKAIRLTKSRAPLEEQEIPIPEPGPDDVLIRIKAAGVCHSDAHYRAGISRLKELSLTLGHEIAGIVESTGERVCIHYLATCGHCEFCRHETEQFCTGVQMIGKDRDGGYAEFVIVPKRSVFRLPDEISFEVAAIMMCSSATSLHALRKARLRAGETVAVFGIGGLGISAVQLARALGAAKVFAIDINPKKLELAAKFGATPIDASDVRDVDVALELIGLPQTMRQALQSLGKMGRAALVGITEKSFEIAPYHEIINKEAEIIGVSDHLAMEIPDLLEFARTGQLDLSHGVIRTIPLQAKAINDALDSLENFGDDVRVVITP